MTAFENEKCKYNCMYRAGRISKHDLFMDWMQGLPSALPLADDIFLGSATEWLGKILNQTEEEKAKYNDDKAEKMSCYLIYREIVKHSLKAN